MYKTKIQSCWNCQHRLEFVDDQSIYCNKFGILNLIDKSGDERGQDCSKWRESCLPPEPLKKSTFALKLFLPLEWQDRLEETAASLSIDPAVWVTNLIGASLFPPSDFDEGSDDKVNFAGGDGNHNGKHPENNQGSALNTAIAPTLVATNPAGATIYDSHSCYKARFSEQPSGGEQD